MGNISQPCILVKCTKLVNGDQSRLIDELQRAYKDSHTEHGRHIDVNHRLHRVPPNAVDVVPR